MIERRFVNENGYRYVVGFSGSIDVGNANKPIEIQEIYDYNELTNLEKIEFLKKATFTDMTDFEKEVKIAELQRKEKAKKLDRE